MTNKNPYRKSSKIGIKKCKEIIKLFALDIPAKKASEILGLSNNSVDNRYNYLRNRIAEHLHKNDTIGLGRHKKGKILPEFFGITKREGLIHIDILSHKNLRHIRNIVREKIGLEKLPEEGLSEKYNGIIDSIRKRFHSLAERREKRKEHVRDSIHNFRYFCKRRFAKFNGIPQEKMELHLKECQFRFNCGIEKTDIYKKLLKILKEKTIHIE